jgi:hypothetical protein
MAMRADLPLPELDTMHVPLDPGRREAVLGARRIWFGSALWALVGSRAQPVPVPEAPRRPVPAGARGRRAAWAVPGQLALFPA